MAQSAITILGLLSMHSLLRKFGNYRVALTLIGIQIIIFYLIINLSEAKHLIPLIVLGLSIASLISLTLDIFLQKNTETKNTGNVRSHFMTAINSAWIMGPLLGGMLIVGTNYKGIYAAAFGLLFPLFYIIHRNFSKFIDPHYPKVSLLKASKSLLKNRDLSKLTIINTVLQVFYSWMTIYTPIYLYKYVGFSWSEISIILTIMLLPFVLIEIPLGKLADKMLGEKEIMAAGYIIMGFATISLSFMNNKNLFLWALVLFFTRVGAAAAEAMIETYFFKKVNPEDSEILGFFRITRPLAFFIAPIITVVGLMFVSNTYLFTIVGVLCIITVIPISLIRDTK
jgi:Na+/melibiose symporter-like transporter